MLFKTTYLKVILKRFGIAKYKPITTPIDSDYTNTIIPISANYTVFTETILGYSLAMGSIIYIMILTWLDITFLLLIINSYCNNLDSTHVIEVFKRSKHSFIILGSWLLLSSR